MKKRKSAIIIALLFIVMGLLLGFIGYFNLHGNYNKLNTENQIEKNYAIDEIFENINIECSVEDIDFVLSDNGENKVVCREVKNISYNIYVENNTLTIKRIDNRKWYENIRIGFYWKSASISIYLSEDEFNSLNINANTSDITVPKNLTFKNIDISTNTGDVKVLALVNNKLSVVTDTGNIYTENNNSQNISLESDTGDISVYTTNVNEKITLETDTGEIALKNLDAYDILAESDTGSIILKDVISKNNLKLNSDTGDINLNDSDSKNIYIETNTGNVYGTLLTDKIFIIKSNTGSINVPKSVSGGVCDVETDTGDIKLLIK